MKTRIQTISAADTAFLLRAKLGPLRAWPDFLADNIRGKQSVHGLTLMPCARKQDYRAFRPIYSIKDVEQFISEVLALEPSAGKVAIQRTVLAIDTGRYWKINKFAEDGSPVMLRRIFSPAVHRPH